ncbi:CoA-binding protein [Candidatus Micrarchaeota archaeon]|nr:CoA-binding protein [Candidatus Micrarchaeota archaeon]
MDIKSILKSSKIIAVVGLSDKQERPSYDVATYLMEHGYTLIPVNPMISQWKGLKAYPSLSEIPREIKIDIVDIFRKSEDVPPIVDEAISIGAKVVWMQLGIVNESAADKAKSAGLQVVMDRCIKIEHAKL